MNAKCRVNSVTKIRTARFMVLLRSMDEYFIEYNLLTYRIIQYIYLIEYNMRRIRWLFM